MQLSMVIVLFGLLLDLMEFNETYKIKPYKYYNPHSWRRPRWHSLPKHRKRYHPKRIPSHKHHHYHEPEYHRYAPYHEDSVDTSDHDKPYVIVIQLPHKHEKKKYRSYQRKHVVDPPQNNDDYIDDADEVKVYKLNN
ncbi:uncharacterized protein LOC105205042 [Solenopsis invicta]|uniref:uncharacterized protein LOC105205042 n=1 Tax=Solenopsis invicta TaxID=13686 RepID=UPI000595885B|nr:uncharacterized protein LOC105205042 [Solenopsis invicta]